MARRQDGSDGLSVEAEPGISARPLCRIRLPTFFADFRPLPSRIMSQTNLPLPVFYAQTLRSLLPVFDDSLSLSDPAAQYILSTGLNDLHLIGRMLSSLGIFSDNETVDELGDGEMAFMTLGWAVGEGESKDGSGSMAERKAALQRSEVRLGHRGLAADGSGCKTAADGSGGVQHVSGAVDDV